MRDPHAALSLARLIGIAEVERATDLHRTTIWRKCRTGAFPAPIYVGDLRKWPETAIAEWLALQAARPASARRGGRNLVVTAAPLVAEGEK